MPKATADLGYERRDLKSLPDESDPGYIMVRPLPYGKKLDRREKAMRMSMESQTDNRGRAADAPDKVDFEFMQRLTRQIEFQYCIGDHNLEDDQGKKLDFNNPATLDVLNPKVGSEIERILDEINGDDVDEEVFTRLPSDSSQKETPAVTTET